MTNVYGYRRRARSPFAGLAFPALVLFGLVVVPRLGGEPAETKPATAKEAPYIRLQSRAERESGGIDETRRASTSPFRNCGEARAAGHENISASSPYYGEHMDGDQDGVACEPPPRR